MGAVLFACYRQDCTLSVIVPSPLRFSPVVTRGRYGLDIGTAAAAPAVESLAAAFFIKGHVVFFLT